GEVNVCPDPLCYDQRITLTVHLVVCEDLHLVLILEDPALPVDDMNKSCHQRICSISDSDM
ncbi:hypothetical protein A2U01_0075580, partial [Trifolium medium]|nr:hypothetical protein [Trifolium medium]